jgi:uridine phosphorylase
MQPISHTDLILNRDGSIYHLHLLPEELADTVILVGDPGRVSRVSAHFDRIEVVKENREFVTHTGIVGGKRITVLSTGIGCDNIDIVLNELDALVNIDLASRKPHIEHKTLDFIRIGTSGALHADISPGARIITEVAGGFDGLYHFYKDPKSHNLRALSEAFITHTAWPKRLADPYFIRGSYKLTQMLSDPGIVSGITLSTPGFYAPQVRSLRLPPVDPTLLRKIGSFRFENMRINNFEMESSALYALAAMLNHHAVTLCVAVANRISRKFLDDYQTAIDALIETVLNKLIRND